MEDIEKVKLIKQLRAEKRYREADNLRRNLIDKNYLVGYQKDGRIWLFNRKTYKGLIV